MLVPMVRLFDFAHCTASLTNCTTAMENKLTSVIINLVQMKTKIYLKWTWITIVVALFSIPCVLCVTACGAKEGDINKFTEIPLDQLTEKNAPKGIVLRDGKFQLDDGYTLVPLPDSTKALIIDPNHKGGGTTAMRCDCDGLIKIGCIPVLEGIITCKPLLCSNCKPVLLVYGGFISIDKFKK